MAKFKYVAMDATGKESLDSIILIVYPGRFNVRSRQQSYKFYPANFGAFGMYMNNLKGAWNKWEI